MDVSVEANKGEQPIESAEVKMTRDDSVSQISQHSQTASDFIDSQLQLEADAREALPYKFEHCTQPLGPLRQNLFSCLTCNPPPDSPTAPYTPAAVCYSCSIACHGEHTLVELFNRRNFTCDCGTTRLPATSPCTLRIDPATGTKGPVHSQAPAEGNTYNQNCRNRFCACGEIYNAEEEKGTMFQCLGLADEADGGCGEDWWHPECVVGLGRDWAKARPQGNEDAKGEVNGDGEAETDDSLPPGFPPEDSFDTFICYKCVEANPWIKRYAGTPGFLPPVYRSQGENHGQAPSASPNEVEMHHPQNQTTQADTNTNPSPLPEPSNPPTNSPTTLKRPLSSPSPSPSSKKPKPTPSLPSNHHTHLPPTSTHTPPLSLFCQPTFRSYLCHCTTCYPHLKPHRQLLEEEESYEPPISESSSEGDGGHSAGTGSLLDRGEAALSNVDRVRAIEGVMVYNHLRDKVKSFLQPFAESGRAVGAEDIKAYFEGLRGDEGGGGDGEQEGDGRGDNRREQSGY